MKKYKYFPVLLLIACFTSVYSLYSIIRHLRLESFLFDLGYYDQYVWLASRFLPLYSSLQEVHIWGGHFNPSMLLLAPLYWVWDNAIVLLLVQALVAAVGVFPLYFLALKYTKNLSTALVVSISYLSFFGITNAIAYDFHPLVLAVTLLNFMLWCYEEKRYRYFWILSILFIGLQENLYIIAAVFGIFLALNYKQKKHALLLTVVSSVAYVVVIFIIVPALIADNYLFLPTRLFQSDASDAPQLITATLGSFAFLPILSPISLMVPVTEWGIRLFAAPTDTFWQFGYHYNSLMTPFLALGSIWSIKRYFYRKQVIAQFLLLAGIVVSYAIVKPDFLKLFNSDFYDISRFFSAQKLISLIPPDASVQATNNLGSHLSQRKSITFLTNCVDDKREWIGLFKRCYQLQAEYLIADLDPKVGNNVWPETYESIKKYLHDLERNGEVFLIQSFDNLYLYRRRL